MSKDFKFKFRVSLSTYELLKLAMIHLEDTYPNNSLYAMRASIVRSISLLQRALCNIDLFLDSMKNENM